MASQRFERPTFVETGTIRSEEDWAGAGFFTYLAGAYLHRRGGTLHSLELDPRKCEFAREWTRVFGETVRVQEVIAAANQAGVPVLVDPARGVPLERYRGATLLKPNRHELELATGQSIPDVTAAISAGIRLWEQTDVSSLLLTFPRLVSMFQKTDRIHTTGRIANLKPTAKWGMPPQ